MKLNFTPICAAMIAAAAVPGGAAEGIETKPLVEGNTGFGVQLYQKLQSTEGNLVFSPYSVSSALAMTYAGALGETARQMEQVLHFDQTKTNLHARFGRLEAALQAAQGSNELSIANSLWPQEKYPFRAEFLDLVKKEYGATVTPLDYERKTEKARAIINQWVDEKTRHKISEIIGPGVLDALTRMVLVNSIYFNGAWATPFPESATRPDNFYVKPDSALTVPFMHLRGQFSYAENDQLQLLALPYVGRQLQLTILLPRSRGAIGQLENSLTPANLARWLAKAKDQNVNVAMPRFKMSSDFRLSETLQAMGMKDAFKAQLADFSGMDGRSRWLYLSAVLHKAFIEVNEKGTEAAAATAVGFALTSARPVESPREFRADHPFLFLVRDSTTGSILFMGRVSDPGSQ